MVEVELESRELGATELLIFMSQKKSPGMCAAVEIFGSFLGFSGIGIMLSGSVGLGIVVMVTYWFWLCFCACAGVATFGLALGLIPLWWLITGISAFQAATTYNNVLVRSLIGR